VKLSPKGGRLGRGPAGDTPFPRNGRHNDAGLARPDRALHWQQGFPFAGCGAWPEELTLQLAALAPPKAIWVGVNMAVQNQLAGDWVEAREFRLRTN